MDYYNTEEEALEADAKDYRLYEAIEYKQAFQEMAFTQPHTYLAAGGFSTMGWSYPAAMGAKLARPDVPVVALVGDGDFLMTIQELATAVQYHIPVVAVVNKIARPTPEPILPFLKPLSELRNFAAIVPVSAARKRGLGELLETLRGFLPLQPAIYGEDEMTDRSERFLAAERIREKLFRLLGQELPYGTSVVIEKFE